MPRPAIRHRTGGPLRDDTPTAGRGKTAAGSRSRRMYRGEDNLSLPGLTRQSILLQEGFFRRLMDARVKPAHDDCVCSRIKHDDAAYRLAGFHGGKALVVLR